MNLMCGSGTILVERLLAGPARAGVGIDLSAEAIAAARANAAAAGVADRVKLLPGDVDSDGWLATGPYDCIYADPSWGDKHSLNEDLHLRLLERAHRGAAAGARLVVLTHEIRITERCLRKASGLWRLDSETKVSQKRPPSADLRTYATRSSGRDFASMILPAPIRVNSAAGGLLCYRHGQLTSSVRMASWTTLAD